MLSVAVFPDVVKKVSVLASMKEIISKTEQEEANHLQDDIPCSDFRRHYGMDIFSFCEKNKTAQLTVYTAAEDYNSLYIWGGGAGRSLGTGMSTGRVQGLLRCRQGHAKLFRQKKSSKLNNYHPAGMTITI